MGVCSASTFQILFLPQSHLFFSPAFTSAARNELTYLSLKHNKQDMAQYECACALHVAPCCSFNLFTWLFKQECDNGLYHTKNKDPQFLSHSIQIAFSLFSGCISKYSPYQFHVIAFCSMIIISIQYYAMQIWMEGMQIFTLSIQQPV